ncbi:MAG TPA: right-handed parallel beta-helix repeat-containing protein, partial [Vicinamibacterales bacterium]|nr:right-handed parallel beta-helix repeat-containing protein [Vicinamibacterales bacterium]
CSHVRLTASYRLSNVTIANSTILSPFNLFETHHATISGNHIMSLSGGPDTLVGLTGGGDNEIVGNTLDGHWQAGAKSGTDDGILLVNEVHDSIRGNDIRNVFDAGIEGVNAVSDTTISGNTIAAVGETGVGAYYCTAWQNNVVDGNRIQGPPRALWFNFLRGKCRDNPPASLAFTGNVFSNNVYVSGGAGAPYGVDAELGSAPGAVHDNVLTDNNFGMAQVLVDPPAGFQNAGGNTCHGGNFGC